MLLLLLAVWLAPLAAIAASDTQGKLCCDMKGSCCRRKEGAGSHFASGPALGAAGCPGGCGSFCKLVRSRAVAAPPLLSRFSPVERRAEPAPAVRPHALISLPTASLFQRPPPSC